MTSYRLNRKARIDLLEIWEHIARDSEEAADRWIRRLLDCCEVLGKNPELGHGNTQLTSEPVRFWAVGNATT